MSEQRENLGVDSLQVWMVEYLAALLGVEARAIDPGERLQQYGLDSSRALELVRALEQLLGRPVPAMLVWEHPTLEALARHLVGSREVSAGTSAAPLPKDEPIAIIGLACRFPGALDVPAFWRLLREGIDAVGEVPEERFDVQACYSPDPAAPGRTLTRWGGFLEQVDRFDAAFFGISPREAEQMDPQQRLVLELAWEALEDAGLPVRALRGSATGVYLGAMWNDYARLSGGRLEAIAQHTATGQDSSVISGRVSYALGLQGPSLTVNTACSSSLVAVHLACQALRQGECSLALVGGVNLILAPHGHVAMSKFGGMSPGGRCRAFDARADGYVRSEGGGVVVLKPLRRALADGDPIQCVIRGSAVNNDGFSNGLTAPNPEAQKAVLREAYARAGVAPERVHYVEAHGTGTLLGDPIEAGALGAVLGVRREPGRLLRMGSVKTNLGHLEAAAGIAGLIKVALAMRHGALPPSLHFEVPNPHIPFEALRLSVQRTLEPWPSAGERPLAGVSAFGFSGTNCHVVVEGLDPLAPVARPPPPLRPVRRLAFIFSGNGSQWPGMGRQLLVEEPVFRSKLQECDEAIRRLVPWSVLDELAAGAPERTADEEAWQLGLFALQCALVELWRSRGVEPNFVMGHSVGEVAAAHVAGVLGLDEALQIIHLFARLEHRTAGQGAMGVVELSPDETRRRLSLGGAGGLCVAAHNSPLSTVVAGPPGVLREFASRLAVEGVRCSDVNMKVAVHGPQMEPLVPELIAALGGLRPRRGTVPFVSTVTGGLLDGECLDAAYWARNLREPVLFQEGIAALVEQQCDTFLEVGPHPILTRPMAQTLASLGRPQRVLSSLRRGPEGLLALRETHDVLREAGRARVETARAELLMFSAHTPTALRELARSTSSLLDVAPAPLRDVAFTLAVRRTHHLHRLAVVARSREELAGQLDAFSRGETPRGLACGEHGSGQAPRRVFVFPGQGGQWWGMGRDLLRGSAAFRSALKRCDEALASQLGWSVLEELSGDFRRTVDRIQPLLFAMQVALAAVWRSWGVEPDMVVGHSLGEVAAAHVAGALTLEDAARIVCVRSRALARIAGRGAMAQVELPEQELRRVLAGLAERVAVGAINGPSTTVLSGEPEALKGLIAQLEQRGVDCRWIQVDVASHSPQTASLREEVWGELSGLRPRRGHVPIYSTVTGGPIDGAALGADYWVRNLCEPVRFFEAVSRLIADGHRTYLEVSPHPVLSWSVEEALRHLGSAGHTLSSTRRGEDEFGAMLEGLGALYTAGHPVRYEGVYPEGGRVVRLAPYPWQRRRFWLEAPAADAPVVMRRTGAAHPLLGARVESSLQEGLHLWEVRLEGEAVDSHLVNGRRVLSGAVIAEFVLSAARELGEVAPEARDVRFTEPLFLSESQGVEAQLVLVPEVTGGLSFRLSSRRRADREHRAGPWRVHATGRLGGAAAPSGHEGWDEEALSPDGVRWGVQACLDVLLQRCARDGGAGCVLAGISSLASWGHAGSYSRLRVRLIDELQGDAVLLDEGGRVGLDMRGVRFHRSGPGLLHTVRWHREPWRPSSNTPGGRWLILAEHGGVGQRLAALLEAQGQECVVVFPAEREALDAGVPEAFRELLEQVRPERGIVYSWGMDADSKEEPPGWELECARLLGLTQALVRTRWLEPPRLWAVVGGAPDAPEGGIPLAQAATWGLGRVIAEEHAGLRFTSVSLGVQPLEEVEGLARLLRSEEDTQQLALKEGARWVPRLVRLEAPVRSGTPVRRDGTYLVTGGLGALGLAVACDLAECGAGALVLVSRGTGGEDARKARQRMERAGARVVAVQADVSSREQLARVLEQLRRELPPLRGVLHAAGLSDDAPLLELDRERLRDVLAPKALGAWHLHCLTRGEPLDFFVLFSSVASWQGVPGQGAYAAANALLDALAHRRRGLGLPALSVGWGGWTGLGLAATQGGESALEYLARRGLGRLTPEAGLVAFRELLRREVPARVLVMPVDSSWSDASGAVHAPPVQTSAAGFREMLRAAPSPARRQALLETYVGEQAAQVLRLPAPELQPHRSFRELGLDSLMGVQLRDRLEAGLGLVLTMTLLWKWGTVEALAKHLAEMLGPSATAEPRGAGGDEQSLMELLSELEQLPDEEVLKRLASE